MRKPAGIAGSMPGTDGFTMAAFRAEDVPVGTELFIGPHIRQLEWLKTGDHARWTAQSGIGEYRIYVYTRSGTVELSCGPAVVAAECTDIDDAKAKAQQHFETVVSGCLL